MTPMLLLSIALAGASLAAAGASVTGGSLAASPGLPLEILHVFEATPGQVPYAAPVRGPDGLFYGTLTRTGSASNGAIYRYDPMTGNVSIVHRFSGADGSRPYAALVAAPSGALYGTTYAGGANGRGTIYRFDVASSTVTVVYSFDINPAFPYGGLALGPSGILYGAGGGLGPPGGIYSFDPATGAFTVLHLFLTGGWPAATPVFASDGRLYGTTAGQVGGSGELFRFDPATSTYSTLVNFDGSTGGSAFGTMIQAGDGRLYGTTSDDGLYNQGTLFRYSLTGGGFQVLHHFAAATGGRPHGGVIQAADGRLYGTTTSGGAAGRGTAYRFDPVSSTITALHHFDGTNGATPRSAFVEIAPGTLAATASEGGIGHGTLFRYSLSSQQLVLVHQFGGNAAGSNPEADILVASDGRLYGTASEGGTGGRGSLFRYDPAAGTFATLHDFDGSTGWCPKAGVIEGGDGNFYGTASLGGSFELGTAYKYEPTFGSVTVLYHFAGPGDAGNQPLAPLVRGSDGGLYGTSWWEYGADTAGALFRIDPATGVLTTLHLFDRQAGGNPVAAVVEASDGWLYGTVASDRGIGVPGLYRYDRGTGSFAYVHQFPSSTRPRGALVEVAGTLYGTASESSGTPGSLFKLDLTTGALTYPFMFGGANGRSPRSSLVIGPDGWLYGTTELGGAFNLGTVFRFDPVTFVHEVVHSFRGYDGANPHAGVVFDARGTMYGTTANGGPKGGGVIFRFLR